MLRSPRTSALWWMLLPLVAGCATTEAPIAHRQPPSPAVLKARSPEPAGGMAGEVFAATRNYQSWPRFAEDAVPRQSSAHGDAWVVGYYNAQVAAALKDGTLPLPNGSIIVKENRYTPERRSLDTITVMAKREGRWFWLQVTPAGELLHDDRGQPIAGFEVSACQGCHEGARANDSVFTHAFAQSAGSR